MELKFKIEQIAIAPRDPEAAKELLTAMGAAKWVEDTVKADGEVFGVAASNVANLSFNYDLGAAKEFEILDYRQGKNWVDNFRSRDIVSHLGMHCTAEQLAHWRGFFADRQIAVAQEVMTQEHSNPAIAGQRWYQYVIFDTVDILGVDLKFIVRRDAPGKYLQAPAE